MSEISKLYENAGVEKIKDCLYCKERKIECLKGTLTMGNCGVKPYGDYPPFTAEKQLAIFKIFCRRYLEVSQHVEENGDLCFGIKATVGDYAVSFNKDFAECLADFVNCLWQVLTEEEKQQVKGILE